MTLRPDNRTRLKDDGHDSPHVEYVCYNLQIRGFNALGQIGPIHAFGRPKVCG